MIVFATWMGIRYVCGGETTWVILLNGIVHVFMFIYYLLTALDGKLKKVLWMKRLITQIQLVSEQIFKKFLLISDVGFWKKIARIYSW